MNIAQRFIDSAARYPDRTFVATASGRSTPDALSYGEAMRKASVLAAQLRTRGVVVGDRVLLLCPNSLDFVCAYFAIWMAGGTIIPLDPRSRPDHVNRIVDDCSAKCVVVPATVHALEATAQQVVLADVDWSSPAEMTGVDPTGNSLALIIYTSGTTGTPRGVCLSHENLEHSRASITSWAKVSDLDRELLTLPLTHLFGLAHLHVYCALGATVYLEDGFRDIPRLLDMIERFGITSFPCTPGGLKIILDRFGDLFALKARRLRYVVINTSPMPVALTRKLLSTLPDTEIFMYYGLTEASRSTYIPYRNHLDKLETVGKATPGSEVCIGQAGLPVIGVPGEILVRGSHVTSGYWRQPSGEFFDDGWFRTGDLGIIDEQGFLTWIGRLREQINVNGLKLVPAEVEEVLRSDSRVADCAVVGVPDAATGESVVAYVVLEESAAQVRSERELRRLCSLHLDDHKVPRRILFIEELPKTVSGKVKRHLLLERWINGER